jgi:predicted esterase
MGRTLLLAVALAWLAVPARGGDLPYPPGRSSQQIEGLRVELDLPQDLSSDKPASLVVVLHGAGGTATGMAGALRAWVPEGYVVAAPKSTGQVWSDADVASVKRIIQHLEKVLPVDPKRLHVVGFSNGGWNLDPIAFDEDLEPLTATWVASGCRRPSPPKSAVRRMGVLALAGTEDPNAKAAAETVKMLRKKVRFVEVRFQQGLGHAWPDQLAPYMRWWMGAVEGRFEPGVDLNFDWQDDLKAAIASQADRKHHGGVMIYAYDGKAKDDALARTLQDEVFMDPLVRWYGGQIPCVKLEAGAHHDDLAALGVKTYPAVVVLDKHGKPRKVLEGKRDLSARHVAKALRGVVPDRKRPEGL